MSSSKKVRDNIKKMLEGSVFGNDPEVHSRDLGLGKGGVELHEIHLDKITAQEQVRRNIKDEDIDELAKSIKSRGLLQPIIVQPEGDGYRIIAGHCRYKAFQKLGYPKILCIIKKPEDASEVKVDQIVENIQRARLSTIDTCYALSDIMEMKNIKQIELAEVIGKSREYISKMMGIKDMVNSIESFNKSLNSQDAAKMLKSNGSTFVVTSQHLFDDLSEDTLVHLSRLPIELVEKAVQKIKEKRLNVMESREYLQRLKEGKNVDEDMPKSERDIEGKLHEILFVNKKIKDKLMKFKVLARQKVSAVDEAKVFESLEMEINTFLKLLSTIFKGPTELSVDMKVNQPQTVEFPGSSIVVSLNKKLSDINYSFLELTTKMEDIKKFIKSRMPDLQDYVFECFKEEEIIDQWNALPFYIIDRSVDGFFFKAVTKKFDLPKKYIDIKNEFSPGKFDKYSFKRKKDANVSN